METDNQAPSLLDLSQLNNQERKEHLFLLVKSFPPHVGYAERIRLIAARAGLTQKTLLQLARRNGWEARLAAEAAAERERAEYNARLDAVAPPAADIPATRIAANVKGLAFTLLGAARRYVDTLCLMLQFYSDKIALRVAEAGGLDSLDTTAAKEIAELQGKLSFYGKQLGPYMAPGPLSTLLATIDFTAKLPANDEGVETQHFTMAALQAKLLQMGMPSAFDNPDRATSGYGDLPEIDGWLNARPDERRQYGLQAPENAAA